MEYFRFLDGNVLVEMLRCIRYMGRRRRCSGAVGLGTVQSPKAKGECPRRPKEQGAGRRDSVGVYVIFLIFQFLIKTK